MGLTFLQQLITVGFLAFASGLLLGVAVLRGEIGGLSRSRRPDAFPSAAVPAHASRPAAPRKRPRSVGRRMEGAVASLRDMDPALSWVLIALSAMILGSAVITRLLE